MSIMDNKVNKSGDTMTGLLQTTSYFRTSGRTTRIIEINSADNTKTWGTFEVNKNSDTETASYIFAFNPTDNNKNATIGIHINGNEKWADCPGSKKNYSIVTTESHGDTWIRFGNGLQICWGFAGANEQLITFPQPFKDTNYSITVTGRNDKNEAYASVIRDDSKTTTSVRTYCRYLVTNYIAIGYWY